VYNPYHYTICNELEPDSRPVGVQHNIQASRLSLLPCLSGNKAGNELLLAVALMSAYQVIAIFSYLARTEPQVFKTPLTTAPNREPKVLFFFNLLLTKYSRSHRESIVAFRISIPRARSLNFPYKTPDGPPLFKYPR